MYYLSSQTHPEGEEQSIHDSEAGDVVRHEAAISALARARFVADLQVVASGEDKSEEGLHAQTEDHGVLGAEVVDNERAGQGSGLRSQREGLSIGLACLTM